MLKRKKQCAGAWLDLLEKSFLICNKIDVGTFGKCQDHCKGPSGTSGGGMLDPNVEKEQRALTAINVFI